MNLIDSLADDDLLFLSLNVLSSFSPSWSSWSFFIFVGVVCGDYIGTDPTNLGNIYAIVVCATTSSYHCPFNQDLGPACFTGNAYLVMAFVNGLASNVGEILFSGHLALCFFSLLLACGFASATLCCCHFAPRRIYHRNLYRRESDICNCRRWIHPHTAPDLHVDLWLAHLHRANGEPHPLRRRVSGALGHCDINDGICHQLHHAGRRFADLEPNPEPDPDEIQDTKRD